MFVYYRIFVIKSGLDLVYENDIPTFYTTVVKLWEFSKSEIYPGNSCEFMGINMQNREQQEISPTEVKLFILVSGLVSVKSCLRPVSVSVGFWFSLDLGFV